MSILVYSYDTNKDIFTIEGIQYTGEFFRSFGGTSEIPLNNDDLFRFVRRKDGSVTIQIVGKPETL